MKIDFDDKSYIEIFLSSPGKIAVVLGAKDGNNSLNTIINSAELSINQFVDLINNIEIPLPGIKK